MNDITVREKEVIFLILKGMGNKEIGSILYISESTVKKHVYNIFNKLEVRSRFELMSSFYDNTKDDLNKAC